MTIITLADLRTALAPIAASALESDDDSTKKAAIVLAALMGALSEGVPAAVLDELALHAGAVCERVLGDPSAN